MCGGGLNIAAGGVFSRPGVSGRAAGDHAAGDRLGVIRREPFRADPAGRRSP